MTHECILEAAINSMIHGHHAPHCFSAWVKGRGYVGQGETIIDGATVIHDRADYLHQLERVARSEVENMGYAQEYCGYSADNQPKRGVLFANWNSLPTAVTDILEKIGYAIEWSDEWSVCDGCQCAIRTAPDSYGYRSEYSVVDDSEILCLDCLQDEYGSPEDYEETES